MKINNTSDKKEGLKAMQQTTRKAINTLLLNMGILNFGIEESCEVYLDWQDIFS